MPTKAVKSAASPAEAASSAVEPASSAVEPVSSAGKPATSAAKPATNAVAKPGVKAEKAAKGAIAPIPTPSESKTALVRRARKLHRELAETHPDAHCELDFTTPLELLVATILSAQSTDKKINEVTPKLFARYPAAADYAGADRAELEEILKPTGFFRNKTTALIGLGSALVERFDGQVPNKMEQLITLPGVGRKTANVVLGNAFGVPGITVDTHFDRLVHRWAWTAEQDPVKVEFAVGELIERKDWTMLSHRVIFHGRRVCHAKKPACGACTLAKMCPSYGIGETNPQAAAKLLKGPRVAELAERAGIEL